MVTRNMLGPTVVFVVVMSIAAFAFGQGQVPPFPSPAGAAGQSPTGQAYDGRFSEGGGRRGGSARPTPKTPTGPTVKLTTPKAKSETSIEQTLWGRRSLRSVTAGQITLEDVSQLLWAAQGITGQWGRRAAPSAGGGYPLEVILVAGDVAGLTAGVYRYYPASNELERLSEGDRRKDLVEVSKFRDIAQAPAVVVITGTESRMTGIVPAGPVAHHTVAIEAGAASQNLVLEAVALGLGTAVVPDSDEAKLIQIIHAEPGERPFVVVVVSRQ